MGSTSLSLPGRPAAAVAMARWADGAARERTSSRINWPHSLPSSRRARPRIQRRSFSPSLSHSKAEESKRTVNLQCNRSVRRPRPFAFVHPSFLFPARSVVRRGKFHKKGRNADGKRDLVVRAARRGIASNWAMREDSGGLRACATHRTGQLSIARAEQVVARR